MLGRKPIQAGTISSPNRGTTRSLDVRSQPTAKTKKRLWIRREMARGRELDATQARDAELAAQAGIQGGAYDSRTGTIR
jgi:hypothetical protein